MSTPAEEPEDDDAPAAQPVWWIAIPALVVGAGVYQLLTGDTGGFWPWGQLVVIAVGLALLTFVLVDRRRISRRD